MLVALTRESGRNEELRQWVGSRADVVEIALTTTSYRASEDVDAEVRASGHFGRFRTLVVTSARAERYLGVAREALDAHHVVASVGAATTRSLDAAGLRVSYESTGGATELAASISEGPVLLLGAVGGREELTTVLTSRDLDCVEVACYATRGLTLDDTARDGLRRADVVFIGAPSAWRVAREVVDVDAWVLVPGATTLQEVRADHERVAVGWGEAFPAAWDLIEQSRH
ncbi:MAG: hypothetical protein HIU57_01745 [Acidobacteria bacterium]|nr:hypothetical protein [Acidobacteriota bacterium]